MNPWTPPDKEHEKSGVPKSARRKQRKMKAYDRRQRKRKRRGLRSQRRDREEGNYDGATTPQRPEGNP